MEERLDKILFSLHEIRLDFLERVSHLEHRTLVKCVMCLERRRLHVFPYALVQLVSGFGKSGRFRLHLAWPLTRDLLKDLAKHTLTLFHAEILNAQGYKLMEQSWTKFSVILSVVVYASDVVHILNIPDLVLPSAVPSLGEDQITQGFHR